MRSVFFRHTSRHLLLQWIRSGSNRDRQSWIENWSFEYTWKTSFPIASHMVSSLGMLRLVRCLKCSWSADNSYTMMGSVRHAPFVTWADQTTYVPSMGKMGYHWYRNEQACKVTSVFEGCFYILMVFRLQDTVFPDRELSLIWTNPHKCQRTLAVAMAWLMILKRTIVFGASTSSHGLTCACRMLWNQAVHLWRHSVIRPWLKWYSEYLCASNGLVCLHLPVMHTEDSFRRNQHNFLVKIVRNALVNFIPRGKNSLVSLSSRAMKHLHC